MDMLLSTTCWETFCARSTEFPRESERMEVIGRIKTATKEYCKFDLEIPIFNFKYLSKLLDEALLLYRQVTALSSPSKRVFRAFESWFQSAEPFVGIDSEMLRYEDDFVALNMSADTDFLTRILQHLVGKYMPVCKPLVQMNTVCVCL